MERESDGRRRSHPWVWTVGSYLVAMLVLILATHGAVGDTEFLAVGGVVIIAALGVKFARARSHDN